MVRASLNLNARVTESPIYYCEKLSTVKQRALPAGVADKVLYNQA